MPGTLATMDAPIVPTLGEERDVDQVVVLTGVSWEQYLALSKTRRKWDPRMAFLDGALELMVTSTAHEDAKIILGRMLEGYALVSGVSLNGRGNATFKRKAQQAGVEPDECYWIGPSRRFPQIAIEVVHTSGGINKLEAYRRLRIEEVWFWINRSLSIYHLEGRAYRLAERSHVLPRLDVHHFEKAVREAKPDEQTEAVRAYQGSLRRRR